MQAGKRYVSRAGREPGRRAGSWTVVTRGSPTSSKRSIGATRSRSDGLGQLPRRTCSRSVGIFFPAADARTCRTRQSGYNPPVFDLALSQAIARRRLGDRPGSPAGPRHPTSDRGSSRIAPEALRFLRRRLLAQERPRLPTLLDAVARFCRPKGVACPSRASVYALLRRSNGHRYRVGDLPGAVQAALYNLSPDSRLPGHQVAFYCFHFGDLAAISFASGLPWLDLHQARRTRGWRPRSRGLLEAACRARGI